MTDNLIEIYEKALDEANNRNTISKNARGGNGKNIYRKNSSNSGKGKTATTIGAHGGSKLSHKKRKALNQQKQQEQKPQTEEPKQEEQKPQTEEPKQEEQKPQTEEPKQEEQKPQTEEPKQEEPKEDKEEPKEDKEEPKEDKKTDSENDLSDADITDETRQESATEIVNKRVTFFNKTLASLYRVAGNLVAHKEVFPIFSAKETQEEQPKENNEETPKADTEKNKAPEQNASFNQSSYTDEMFKHIKLFEDDERVNQTPEKSKENTPANNNNDNINFQVTFATKMSTNKFTSNLNTLAKVFNIDGFDSLTNIGKFCAVVGGLIGKYRELAENIAKVNEYIKVDEIKLDGESINMNINNAQLKQLFKYFKGTPGESALRVLNAFCAKNITSITANTNLNELIKALPNEINADFAKKFSTNTFTLSLPKKVYADKNFPKSWFNIEEAKKEEKPTENNKTPAEKPKEEKPTEDNKPETDIDKSKNKEGAKPSEQSSTEQNPKK